MTRIIMVPGATNFPSEGVKRHVYEISKRIGKKGFEVINVVPSNRKVWSTSTFEDAYKYLKVPVMAPELNSNAAIVGKGISFISHYLRYREALKRVLSSADTPTVIHTHGFYVSSQPRKSSKICKRLATIHGFLPLDFSVKETENKVQFRERFQMEVLRRLYMRADGWTAISNRISSVANECYGIRDYVTVTPHGVDTAFFSKKVEQCEIDNLEKKFKLGKPHKILFLGQLDKGKRPDLLLRAFKLLVTNRSDVMLVMRSNWGDYYSQTLELIKSLHLEDVVRIIDEPIFGDQLVALYRSSNIFVNLHSLIGPSTALLEAMASGIPSIVCPGGNGDVVGDFAGITLSNINPLNVADKIQTLIDDPPLAKRLGQNGASRMKSEYDWENVVVPKYISVYSKLLSG